MLTKINILLNEQITDIIYKLFESSVNVDILYLHEATVCTTQWNKIQSCYTLVPP